MTLAGLALLLGTASAAALGGVELPDSVELGGQQLLLNGLGLREFLFIDIYVGGLYLPTKTTEEEVAIQADVPKRLVLHFVHAVGLEEMRKSTVDAVDKNPSTRAEVMPHIERLNGAMEAMEPGDVVVFEYVPGHGTRILVKGELKDTIEGLAFMRGLWTLYLGPSPPTRGLKRGLLGG